MWRKGSVCVVVALLGCGRSERDVKAEFDAFVAESNMCTAASDCARATADCPLGCTRAVRVDRVAAVEQKARELIAEYERGGRTCQYDCVAPGTLSCEHGRCTETFGGVTCTEIGCGPAFSVHFDKPAPWASGRYRVALTLDGRSVECAADVPLRCDAPPACPDSAVLLQLSGCALPAEAHAITGVDLLEPASAVTIDVTGPGGSLAHGSFQPHYTTSTPNGPECSPTCTGAPSETLAF